MDARSREMFVKLKAIEARMKATLEDSWHIYRLEVYYRTSDMKNLEERDQSVTRCLP